MPGRPDINPTLLAEVNAKTPGALPILGGRDGQTIVGYQVPQNVGSPPATQAEIDAAQAKADAISKAVGTTVDLVYPQTKGGHDGALVEDRSAAPIGFRFDNGQSQYVNMDINGQVTGVQQRGGGLAAVLPFIEKAVEFVFPATIPFIEGANALYAASQGNIAGALAGAANMGIQIPGVDTSSFKSVTNYVNGANALAKGDIGGLVNAVGNATDDPSLKANLKTAAQDIGIAQSVAGGNPMAALKSVMGSAGSGMGGVAETDAELAAEEARVDAQMKAKAAEANAAADALRSSGILDQLTKSTDSGGAGDDTVEGGLTRGLENATDLGKVDVTGKNAPEAGWDSWNAPGLNSLSPVTVTGNRNLITDSGLPVNPNVGYHNPDAELAPVTVTGQRNPITDSGLPVDPNVGYHNPDAVLNPVEVSGTRSLSTELNPQETTGTRGAGTELAPVTITGSRGNNTITDSSLPVNADVGSSALDQVTVSGTRQGTDLEPVTVSGTRELPAPLTVDQLPALPEVTPLKSGLTAVTPAPKPVTPVVKQPSTTTGGGGSSASQGFTATPTLLKNNGAMKTLHLTALKQLYQSLDPDLAAALGRQGVISPEEEKSYMDQVAAMDDTPNPDTQTAAQGGSIVGVGALAHGGLPARFHPEAPRGHNPEFITGKTGFYAAGKGTGQSDDIPAMLHDGDYVIDADAVAALGDGSSKAGSSALDQLRTAIPHKLSEGGSAIPAKIADGEYVLPNAFVTALGNGSNQEGAKLLDGMREELRAHKRSAPTSKIPPKAKSPLDYLRMAKG